MKILTLDIESTPNLGYIWELYDQNVAPSSVVAPREMISYAAKWHGERKTSFYSTFHDGKPAMLKALWNQMDEADAIIAEAQRQGIYITQDKELVAALSRLDLEQEIPQDLYTAVAVVLSAARPVSVLVPASPPASVAVPVRRRTPKTSASWRQRACTRQLRTSWPALVRSSCRCHRSWVPCCHQSRAVSSAVPVSRCTA